MIEAKLSGKRMIQFTAFRAKIYLYMIPDVVCSLVLCDKGKKCVIKEDKKF